jgi:hypothetical protein
MKILRILAGRLPEFYRVHKNLGGARSANTHRPRFFVSETVMVVLVVWRAQEAGGRIVRLAILGSSIPQAVMTHGFWVLVRGWRLGGTVAGSRLKVWCSLWGVPVLASGLS